MNQQVALGVALGVGCALLIPVVGMAVAAGGARPARRALARGGCVFGEKTREVFSELGEVYEDFIAEARAGGGQEQAKSAAQQPASAAPSAGEPAQ